MYRLTGAGAISSGTMFLSVPGAFSPLHRMVFLKWHEDDSLTEEIVVTKSSTAVSPVSSSDLARWLSPGLNIPAPSLVPISAGR